MNLRFWLSLIKTQLYVNYARKILLITLAFVIVFDILIGLYVLKISTNVYTLLSKYLKIDEVVYYRTIFSYLLYMVYAFSFTMLAIELPLDVYSREIENGTSEILTFYTSRSSYFFSKLFALMLVIYSFLFIHISVLYLVFKSYIELSYLKILEISLALFYQIGVIVSISLLLDIIFTRTKLVPSVLGVLSMLAGSYVVAQLAVNFSSYLQGSYFLLSNSALTLSEQLQKLYLLFAKLSSFKFVFERTVFVKYLLYPFVNYFLMSFYYIQSIIFSPQYFELVYSVQPSWLDFSFSGLWSLGLTLLAYAHFKYRDL